MCFVVMWFQTEFLCTASPRIRHVNYAHHSYRHRYLRIFDKQFYYYIY